MSASSRAFAVALAALGGLAPGAASADVVPVGKPRLVNTFTTGSQFGPRVAADADGDTVIVWTSSAPADAVKQDGSGSGVYGRLFGKTGSPKTSEFRVNQVTASDQVADAVDTDAAGNFVVSWTSLGQDGSGKGVYARRYNGAGTALGAEFRVHNATKGDQTDSRVAINADGRFVVTWVGPRSVNGATRTWTWYRTFAADGTALTGDIATQAVAGAGAHTRPALAWPPEKDPVAVYTEEQCPDFPLSTPPDCGGHPELATRICMSETINPFGAPRGGRIRVPPGPGTYPGSCDVGVDADGNAVVAFRGDLTNPAGARGTLARRFDSDGNAIGSLIGVEPDSAPHAPGVSVDAGGRFVVAYAAGDSTGLAQLHGANGAPTASPAATTHAVPNETGEFLPNLHPDNAMKQAIAMDDDGDIVTVDTSVGRPGEPSGDPNGIVLSRFTSDPSVRFAVSGSSVSEGSTSIGVTVRLSSATSFNVTVPLTVSGTATKAVDYQTPPSLLTIVKGTTSTTFKLFPVNDDTPGEGNETIVLKLGTPTNAVPGTPGTHTVTIVDND